MIQDDSMSNDTKQYYYLKKIVIFITLFLLLTLCSIWLWNNYFLMGKNTGFLADYELIKGPVKIADDAEQSSGLAFNEKLNQLYVIVNSPQQIHRLTEAAEYIDTINLEGYKDTEGIAYLGEEKFAIIDERSGIISWFNLHSDTRNIKFNVDKSITLFDKDVGNIGLEGITYDAQTQQLFVVKERNPKKIYSISWPVKNLETIFISHPWDAESQPWWSTRNLSGIHYHAQTGHLFVLSRRSRRIIEYTLSGQEVGSFSLKNGSANLPETIGKAEGIVMSNEGTLYLCGEPNQLYIFKKINRQ